MLPFVKAAMHEGKFGINGIKAVKFAGKLLSSVRFSVVFPEILLLTFLLCGSTALAQKCISYV